jgi:putative FmdB family regulatory protein
MPIYEYECSACQKRFERIQRLSDPLLTVCPQCGGGVHKAFSVPAIQFKGSGWYVTDYSRRGGGSSSASSESTGAKSAGDSVSAPKAKKAEGGSNP